MTNFVKKIMRIHYFSPNHLKTEYIQLYSKNCISCWECVKIYPQKVIEKADIIIHKHSHIDTSNECIGCLKYVKTFKNGAINPIKI